MEVNELSEEAILAKIEKRAKGELQSVQVPEFPPVEWLNTKNDIPLSFKEHLSGKIVILDFWTYCCINCLHALPELEYLENKFHDKNEIAFIGVHSAKFTNEKLTKNIRNAILRHNIEHAVANDREMKLWEALNIEGIRHHLIDSSKAWPSFAIIGPDGKILHVVSGEASRSSLELIIQHALDSYKKHQPSTQWNLEKLPLFMEKDKVITEDNNNNNSNVNHKSLNYPSKLAVDETNRILFIADSANHRIIVSQLNIANGNIQHAQVITTIGGQKGFKDGDFSQAQFNFPQGIAFSEKSNKIYVCDTENHALREIDFNMKKVTTIAGNGTVATVTENFVGGGIGTDQQLTSPWDVVVQQLEDREILFIAMAGSHQIWKHDTKAHTSFWYCGSKYGRELNRNGDFERTCWAQPSGLALVNHASLGNRLYVADSESSSIRYVDLKLEKSFPIVGGDRESLNLFAMGDVDGKGYVAKLQHPLAVCHLKKKDVILVCDSYNHKVKILTPAANSITSWLGSETPGSEDGVGKNATFNEPAGVVTLTADNTEYIIVADTNNHKIRVIPISDEDISLASSSTLSFVWETVKPIEWKSPESIKSLVRASAVKQQHTLLHHPSKLNAPIRVHFTFDESSHLNNEAESQYQVVCISQDKENAVKCAVLHQAILEKPTIEVDLAKFANLNHKPQRLEIEAILYYCVDTLCKVQQVKFLIELKEHDSPSNSLDITFAVGK